MWSVIDFSILANREITTNLISTLVLFVMYLVVRIVSFRAVSRLHIENGEIKRKWFVYVKNITTIIFFIALFLIWASKLEAFALSFAAVAAAIAISFKEYFLCLLGGIFKSSSQLFRVGDRIEISNRRGDVIDHDFLTTTLLEIGPGHQVHQFTGRTIVLPNSFFLTHALINETASTPVGLHSFEFPAYITDDLEMIEKTMLVAVKEVVGPYIEQARQTYRRVARTQGIEEPSVEPRISAYFPEAHRVIFVVRFPTPIKRKGKTEQEIVKRFLKAIPKEAFDRSSERSHD